MANKKISELEPGQQVVSDTQLPGSLGAQTFKYTADQLAAYVQSKDTAGDIDGPLTGVEVVGIRGRSVSATEPTNGQILQWNGTAWVPVAVPASGFDPVIHEYTTPVTDELLTIPTGCKVIEIVCIGAGGGGGSGRRGAAGSIRCGGGGGGGGGYSFATIKAADVTGPLKITVGTGGAGGAAQAANDTNGVSGSAGGTTQVRSNTNDLLCRVVGSISGGGGTSSIGSAGGVGTVFDFAGASGAIASNVGDTGQSGSNSLNKVSSGGASGGGIGTGNLASNGGSGGALNYNSITQTNAGTVASPNGLAGYQPIQGQIIGGGGGGGGASSLTAAGGNGGNGTRGGGGGGGGASVNGNNSGAGGNGGDGYVRIIFS